MEWGVTTHLAEQGPSATPVCAIAGMNMHACAPGKEAKHQLVQVQQHGAAWLLAALLL